MLKFIHYKTKRLEEDQLLGLSEIYQSDRVRQDFLNTAVEIIKLDLVCNGIRKKIRILIPLISDWK